jgi:hypothetical protein
VAASLNCETSTFFLRMSNSASVPVSCPGRSSLAPTSQDRASSGATPESMMVPLASGAMVEVGRSDCE